ncbi:uncharacterized protein LOC120178355 [Hibiscus syriacus]|uniref:uncharacterized protein LOC120178355 n=1 Tax=Hibiscus syriacus TaxID=106335 RepID=UPI001923E948|nr:uncharacterized protein LOC120178355 [Hibiscus syriacus]
MEAAEMRMFDGCGRTLWDMTPNSVIRMYLRVVPLERKRALGLPLENQAVKLTRPIAQEEEKDGNDRVKRAFQTLLIYVRNVVKSPDEEKFRKIRLGNPKFQERVGILKEGLSFSSFADSREVKGTSSWFFSDKVDIRLLNYAGSLLNSAMTNPFFGLLEKVKED